MPCRVLRPQTDGSLIDVTRTLFGNGALPGAIGPGRIVVGDFNKDGRPDIYVGASGWDAFPYPGDIGVLLISNPDGTYSDRSSTLPQTPAFTHDTCIGDIDGDGNLDIYVGNVSGQNSVGPYFLMGNGDGTFVQSTNRLPAQIANLNEKFTACALVDVDQDGSLDLVLGTHGDRGFLKSIILFNNGSGDFTVRPRYELPPGPLGEGSTVVEGIGVLDINQDGKPDLILTSSQITPATGAGIQVLINQGGGTFTDESSARLGASFMRLTGSPPSAPRFVDLNGDGKMDFYSYNGPAENVYRYWINNGNGTFYAVPPSQYTQGEGFGLAAVNFDSDSSVDLVQISQYSLGDVHYMTFLNTAARTAPTEPRIGAAIAGNGQISVAFTPPLFPGASTISSYAATCRGSSGAPMVSASGSSSPIVVPGLVNFVPYICNVTATNANATSLPSEDAGRAIPFGPLLVSITGNGTSSLGSPVTLTATLANGIAPSGTVTFKVFGSTIAGCGNRPVSSNVATCTTSALAYGAQSIRALYSGDANNPATASPAVTQNVTGGFLALMDPVYVPTVAAGSTVPIYTTIQNTGAAGLTINGVAFTGPYSMNQNMCGPTLAAGESCQITLNYSPMATSGFNAGTMTITHSGGNNPFVTNLNGKATSLAAPVLSATFSPAQVVVGNANATLTLALGNPNSVPLINVDIYFNLTANLLTAAAPNPTSTCSGGTWGPARYLGGGPLAGRTAAEFSGGIIPANSACTISVDVSYSGGIGTPTVPSFPFSSDQIYAMFAPVSLVVTPPPTVPDPPTSVSVAPGDGLARVTFLPPVNNGGSPITSYHVSCSGGPTNVPVQSSPVILTGLNNGTSYGCQVTATNSIGTSTPSAVVNVTPASNAPLFLVAVQSRKTHSTAGTFDLNIDPTIPPNGAVSVEPRIGASGHTIVFQFNVLLASAGSVSVTDSISGPVNNVTTTLSGRDVIVTVPGIPDNRRVTITLTGVVGPSDSAGASSSIGFLVGDVNGSHAVNAGDVSVIKAHVGQATNLMNFWLDLNGSGAIGPADVSAVKARSGLTLP